MATNSTPHHLRKASACTNHFLHFGDYTVQEVFSMITSNALKATTDKIRALLEEGKKKEADELKRTQYGYTPSSLWFPTRRESNIKAVTGNIIVEWDDLDQKQLEHIAYFTYTDVFSMLGFVTSSGRGYKIVCPTNATSVDEHRLAYKQLCKYYSDMFGDAAKDKLDDNQLDTVRQMFLSCDQSICAFFKTDYSAFHFVPAAHVVSTSSTTTQVQGSAAASVPEPVEGTAKDSPVDVAEKMIGDAVDGSKHNTLLRASILLGGYVAGGGLAEDEAVHVLENAISKRQIESFRSAQKTIADGIRFGKTKPIYK